MKVTGEFPTPAVMPVVQVGFAQTISALASSNFAFAPAGIQRFGAWGDAVSAGFPKMVRWRVGIAEHELASPPSVSIDDNHDGTFHITDEHGAWWKVKNREGKVTGDDNVMPYRIAPSLTENPRVSSPKTCEEWPVPADQEQAIDSFFVMWKLTGRQAHLDAAIMESAQALVELRLGEIEDMALRKSLNGIAECLFRHTHFAGIEVSTREEYDTGARILASRIAPGLPDDEPVTHKNLLKYRSPLDAPMPEAQRRLYMDHLMAYMHLMSGQAYAISQKGVGVFVHPDTYEWAEKFVPGILLLAVVMMHEMEHMVWGHTEKQTPFAKFSRAMVKTSGLNVLLNPLHEIAAAITTSVDEGRAKATEWELYSRIHPTARLELQRELSETAGLTLEELFIRDRADAVKELKRRYSGRELVERRIAAALFYRLFDAAHMTKAEYMKMIRAVDGLGWRMPFKLMKMAFRDDDDEQGRRNFRRLALVLRALLLAAKIAGWGYVIYKILTPGEKKNKTRPANFEKPMMA